MRWNAAFLQLHLLQLLSEIESDITVEGKSRHIEICLEPFFFFFFAKMGEKLIEEVRQHPPLLDKQDPEYKNQPLKQALWKEIENELGIKGNYI